jgi:choline dehydrogenase-like flavoprotein
MTNTASGAVAFTGVVAPEEASSRTYDVVIVGAGIAASIVASELTREQGVRVLIIEAGLGHVMTQEGYQGFVETFYSAINKDNNAPYPMNPNADMPRASVLKQLAPGETTDDAYWVQFGPYVSDSSYSRVLGGTTMHWEGKTIRMLRQDFKMKTTYGQGLDWPIGLDDLMPYYRRAESEIGVSGEVSSQRELGVEFEDGYVYPMHEMPPSYLDTVVAKDFDGMRVCLDDKKYELKLTTFPQGRNGIPNEAYRKWNGGKLFAPVGAVTFHQSEEGERCQGNTNCVPICPVQAKYDARKTLVKALASARVDVLTQAVASEVHFDTANGAVKEITVKIYQDRERADYRTFKVRGRVFILAANAVENARLLLESALRSNLKLNERIGQHLMDHPYLLAWGQMRQNGGVGRGPLVTSGISNLRNGSFRRKQAAFSVDIHNDGWGWADGSPVSKVMTAVDDLNKYGRALRQELVDAISRQLLLAFMVEMPPERTNCVTVDPAYPDALGNLRPKIKLNVPDYSMAGIEYARNFSRLMFQRIGAEDFTQYDRQDYGYRTYNGQGYEIRGGNHLAGTHIMGTSSADSVVDSYQKSWDHPNLYVIGAGSMPTIGTSNTTLSITALCLRTSEAIARELKQGPELRSGGQGQ